MSEIFYQKNKTNLLDNFNVRVKEIYNKFPITKKINPKPNRENFMRNIFYRIYSNSIIPLKIRNYLWHYFRGSNLDIDWFDKFNKYWIHILGGRPFWNIQDLFFFKNWYRFKFQFVQVPDTDDPFIHLEAWQRPEVIYQLLFLICKEAVINQNSILHLLKKKKKRFNSILEFGCGMAPITTTLFEFHRLPKNLKIFISDIQTLAFHCGAYKFRKCSNVIPILLQPENDFLLDLNENVDVIFCIRVFEHLNKPLETIQIFHEILENNGLLLFDFIITEGNGLDTHHSYRNREEVLKYITENFKVIHGNIKMNQNLGLTIIKKI